MYCDAIFSFADLALFGRILPLIFSEFVPEEDQRWNLYLRIMEIVDCYFH